MQKSFTEYCRSYLFDAIQARVWNYVEGRSGEPSLCRKGPGRCCADV